MTRHSREALKHALKLVGTVLDADPAMSGSPELGLASSWIRRALGSDARKAWGTIRSRRS